jgi:hypothetical protein
MSMMGWKMKNPRSRLKQYVRAVLVGYGVVDSPCCRRTHFFGFRKIDSYRASSEHNMRESGFFKFCRLAEFHTTND